MDPDATPPEGLPEATTPPSGLAVEGRDASAGAVRRADRSGGAAGRTGAARVRPVRNGVAERGRSPAERTGGHRARPAGGSAVERTGGHRKRPAEGSKGSKAEQTGGHRARPAAEQTGPRRARRAAAPPHGHGHGPPAPVARRVRIAIACLLVPAALATLVGLVLLFPFGGRPAPAEGAAALPRIPGEVTSTARADCNEPGDAGCVALTVVPGEGPLAGRPVTVLVSAGSERTGVPTYAVGDPVHLVTAGDPADPSSYEVADFRRDLPLALLAALFAAAVVLLGRWRGLAALVALGLTGVVLVVFVLPAILAGESPLAVAVVGSCAIMFGVLYLTHGVSARTSTAVLGTLASLLLIGLLGVLFTAAARLTGLDEDTANLTAALGADIDARGLVLAGLVIGALGALDDVTVTQTSAVFELRAADPRVGAGTLFAAAMRIGRDHVSSSVNTLVLAYAGAALPLLLLFAVAARGLGDALTTQVIATEVVRTLVGSIGIVAAVPITTALAVAVSSGQTGASAGRP